jgi:hypothetical protein
MRDPVRLGRQSHTDGTIHTPCRGVRHRIPRTSRTRCHDLRRTVTAGAPAGWRGVCLSDGAERDRDRRNWRVNAVAKASHMGGSRDYGLTMGMS